LLTDILSVLGVDVSVVSNIDVVSNIEQEKKETVKQAEEKEEATVSLEVNVTDESHSYSMNPVVLNFVDIFSSYSDNSGFRIKSQDSEDKTTDEISGVIREVQLYKCKVKGMYDDEEWDKVRIFLENRHVPNTYYVIQSKLDHWYNGPLVARIIKCIEDGGRNIHLKMIHIANGVNRMKPVVRISYHSGDGKDIKQKELNSIAETIVAPNRDDVVKSISNVLDALESQSARKCPLTPTSDANNIERYGKNSFN
jgi:hypothetical protein